MHITPEDFGKLFNTFKREAFRLETLGTYTIPEEQATFRAFLNGEPQPEAHKNAPWVNVIKEHVASGRRLYRVHVVTRPLSDYLRYEMAWGYHRNQQAGEEFFILDVTEVDNPLEGVPDFWMYDEATVVTMKYDDDGRFLGAQLVPSESAQEYNSYRDIAVANAEPFTAFWERYGRI